VLEKLLRDDKADAVYGAAMAGIVLIVFEIEPIIKSEFLPGHDIASGDNPDPPLLQLGVAVGGAAMV